MKNRTDVKAGSVVVSPQINVNIAFNVAVVTQIGLINVSRVWQRAR